MLLSRLALSSLALSGRYCGIGGSHVIGRSMGGVRMMSLPTDEAKALHALGFNIGTQLGDIKVGFDESEIDYILSGIKASLSDEPPDVPLSEYVPRAAAMIQAKKAKMSEKAAAAGLEALEAAAKEEGATQTESGLVIKNLVEGDGASPTAADTVEVHYEGTLVDGTIFDSSYKRGETISFPLSGVIKGWTEVRNCLAHPLHQRPFCTGADAALYAYHCRPATRPYLGHWPAAHRVSNL